MRAWAQQGSLTVYSHSLRCSSATRVKNEFETVQDTQRVRQQHTVEYNQIHGKK